MRSAGLPRSPAERRIAGRRLHPLPGILTEEDQDGKDLKSPHDHAQREDQLRQGRKDGEVAHGADQFQAGTDVADTGHHCRKGCSKGEVIQGDEQRGPEGDEHIGPQEDHHGMEYLFIHDPAVQADHIDGTGMEDLADLPPDTFKEKQDPGALYAAAGRAGAGPAEHKDHQQGPGELRPEVEIHAGETGGGDDRGDLKEGVAQGGQKGAVHALDIAGDEENGTAHHAGKKTEFIAFERLTPFSAQDQEVEGKIHGKEKHSDAEDDLHRGALVGADGQVAGGEAARAGSGKGMCHRVEPVHSGGPQGKDHQHREDQIDAVQDLGGLRGFGHQFTDDGPGRLGLHHMKRARAQGGEKGDGQDQDPHAAQPMDEGAPEENALRKRLHSCEDRGSGGGEAGDGLEQAVHKTGKIAGELEGKRPEKTHQKPDESGRKEALSGVETRVGPQQR